MIVGFGSWWSPMKKLAKKALVPSLPTNRLTIMPVGGGVPLFTGGTPLVKQQQQQKKKKMLTSILRPYGDDNETVVSEPGDDWSWAQVDRPRMASRRGVPSWYPEEWLTTAGSTAAEVIASSTPGSTTAAPAAAQASTGAGAGLLGAGALLWLLLR